MNVGSLQAEQDNTNVSVALFANEPFVNLTMFCAYGQPPGPPESTIDNDIPITGLSALAGEALRYEFSTPLVAGDMLSCQTSGDNVSKIFFIMVLPVDDTIL